MAEIYSKCFPSRFLHYIDFATTATAPRRAIAVLDRQKKIFGPQLRSLG
jgi:hypothetical protein